METFFDHNPTPEEIKEFVGEDTKQEYIDSLSYKPEGANLLFIALLYEERGDKVNFEKYKNKVPDLYEQWKLAFNDNLMIPIN